MGEGVQGTDTSPKLLDTLLFQVGLNFGLRAGQEHRHLRLGPTGQITFRSDPAGKLYLEDRQDVSKTNSGGILHRKVKPKVTRAYENSSVPERCPVSIYEKYISLR